MKIQHGRAHPQQTRGVADRVRPRRRGGDKQPRHVRRGSGTGGLPDARRYRRAEGGRYLADHRGGRRGCAAVNEATMTDKGRPRIGTATGGPYRRAARVGKGFVNLTKPSNRQPTVPVALITLPKASRIAPTSVPSTQLVSGLRKPATESARLSSQPRSDESLCITGFITSKIRT